MRVLRACSMQTRSKLCEFSTKLDLTLPLSGMRGHQGQAVTAESTVPQRTGRSEGRAQDGQNQG